MRSLFFLLVFGLAPLSAQTSIDDSAKFYQTLPPTPTVIAPSAEATSTAVTTNFTLPTPPLIEAKLDRFTVSPGTMREGLTYREGAKTIVTLTIPANKKFICAIVSSDPERLACGSIVFQKGDMEGKGAIEIKWKSVDHDCQIALKAYDPDHPEIVLHSRLYLYKSAVDANADAEVAHP